MSCAEEYSAQHDIKGKKQGILYGGVHFLFYNLSLSSMS